MLSQIHAKIKTSQIESFLQTISFWIVFASVFHCAQLVLFSDQTKYITRTADSIIHEVEANHQNNVREQIYQALLKWYQLSDPRKVDLAWICNAIDSHSKNKELSDKLRREFSQLFLEVEDAGVNVDHPVMSLPVKADVDISFDSFVEQDASKRNL